MGGRNIAPCYVTTHQVRDWKGRWTKKGQDCRELNCSKKTKRIRLILTIVKDMSDTITSKGRLPQVGKELPTFALTVIFTNCLMFCPKVRKILVGYRKYELMSHLFGNRVYHHFLPPTILNWLVDKYSPGEANSLLNCLSYFIAPCNRTKRGCKAKVEAVSLGHLSPYMTTCMA